MCWGVNALGLEASDRAIDKPAHGGVKIIFSPKSRAKSHTTSRHFRAHRASQRQRKANAAHCCFLRRAHPLPASASGLLQEAPPARRCQRDVLLLLLPSAAATCCCCDVACFLLFSFASSCSPSGAFACSSFSCVFFLGGACSRRSPAASRRQSRAAARSNKAFALDRPYCRRGVRTSKKEVRFRAAPWPDTR